MIANQTLFNPAQLVLELNEAVTAQAWQQSKAMANPQSRWQGYLNQLTLSAFLSWIQEEETAKEGLESFTQANLWEVVNGTVIDVSGAKLALIPSEAEDLEELRVPQEWIDIPELVADYYLGVQVNVDVGYIVVEGNRSITMQPLVPGGGSWVDQINIDFQILFFAFEIFYTCTHVTHMYQF